MNIPPTPGAYSQTNESSFRQAVVEEDRRNLKRGEEMNPERFVLTDTVTGTRYMVTIVSGVLTLTAL